ncbi:MAG: 30S ribosomal protein S4, partial [Chloroflexota bacterium]|nr:30S ribosomal protein S4 [Chloroflexota bacterium]
PVQKKLRALGLESYGVYGTRKDKRVNQGFVRRRRVSAYGLQLKEKQKAKFIYGILEKQFKNYYDKALDQEGVTGDNLVILLERRLDNVLYRSGMFLSRKQSRQAANHGHFNVNGRKVDIPSFQVSQGDKVEWTERGKKTTLFEIAQNNCKSIPAPHWIELEQTQMQITVVTEPTADDSEPEIDTTQIVELYSK